ncbi:MAG: GNAT family N-acetyltransferase [Gammaproteobacteria bacterium]|nr:GNAT family N-acetyltransferase [Gammaproteobacteria bacterium]
MNVEYTINKDITVDEFVSVLKSSTLAERRPVDDLVCMRGMLEHANLIVQARINSKLVGVVRSVTDFNYCCYLSDIAVDKSYQSQGIGRKLIELTREQLGRHCKLILLSAPAAVEYYPKLGFLKHDQAWLISADQPLL